MRCIKFSVVLRYKTNHPITTRRADLVLIHQKKEICDPVDFAVPADQRVKIKENEKID